MNPYDLAGAVAAPMDVDLGTLQPLAARVAVFIPKPADTTPGGIALPVESLPTRGIVLVVAVGPDVTTVFPGDHVVVGEWAGAPVLIRPTMDSTLVNFVPLKLVNEEDIVAVFRP